MVEEQQARISVEPGDVRALPGDILVVPTATDGHIGPPWEEMFSDLGMPTRHAELALGAIELQSAPPDAPVRYFAFVGSLDRRVGRSQPDVLERIGHQLGQLTHREEQQLTLLSGLAGPGFVELDGTVVLTALVHGFAEVARPDSHLRFAIEPRHLWDHLQSGLAKVSEDAGVSIEIGGTRMDAQNPRLEDVGLTKAARDSLAYASVFAKRRAMAPSHGIDAITMMLGTFARSRHSGGVTAAFLAWLAAKHPEAPGPERMMQLIAGAATIDEVDTTGVELDQPSTDPTWTDLLADAIAITKNQCHLVSAGQGG